MAKKKEENQWLPEGDEFAEEVYNNLMDGENPKIESHEMARIVEALPKVASMLGVAYDVYVDDLPKYVQGDSVILREDVFQHLRNPPVVEQAEVELPVEEAPSEAEFSLEEVENEGVVSGN